MSFFLENIAKLDERLRPIINNIVPFPVNSFFYSNARKIFITIFSNTKIPPINTNNRITKLWDINFNCSIFNAAGMFKNGEGYYTSANMGAGAYIAGTTTYTKRNGNKKKGVTHPFMPYPYSQSSSNWMGLPNYGHHFVAKKISEIQKIKNCPIGVSISESPDNAEEIQKIKEVVEGIKLYEKAKVDFIELNLSCPNVQHSGNSIDSFMVDKLTYLSDNFLKNRNRNLPLIVKFSNDINENELCAVIDTLIDLEFDGINIGNTSTRYEHYLPAIHPKDIHNYQKFTTIFGGGLSGEILKNNSLHLSKLAVEHINSKNINKEFNVVRTGGISSSEDIKISQQAGIQLNQWFSGFFEMFCKYGFNVYREIMSD